MTVELKDAHKAFLNVVLGQLKYRKMLYIYNGRESLRAIYNRSSGRNVSIGTIDRYIKRLKEYSYIYRTQMIDNLGILGKRFKSSITKISKGGLHALEMMNIGAFKIVKEIEKIVITEKKRTPRSGKREVRKGTFQPIGGIVGEIKGDLKLP